ncbi:hypothetical protein MPOCJGCO_3221 [Methylobacterium trifolii]|uniref:Uncharacterized protein n=1 Tax=Methylobacterium trifolii TaxID=1003092 RepID=A0ABQ4U5L0_9HYPH|nr:hypothetical protein MPOCJGCO_3221 [Methylobacterium trifolii]
MTVIGTSVAPVRVMVKVAVPAASDTVTSLMAIVGAGSSLVIVPTPWVSVIVALVAPERFTRKLSLGSKTVSPLASTVMVRLVVPGAKVSVPEVAV